MADGFCGWQSCAVLTLPSKRGGWMSVDMHSMPQGRIRKEEQDDGREVGRSPITQGLVQSTGNHVSVFKGTVVVL